MAIDLAHVADAGPVLLGGAGGVLLVWWLDGIRTRRRERHSLVGATDLVAMELGANITQAHIWGVIATQPRDCPNPGAPPIEMLSRAWVANQNELARALPRELVGHIEIAYQNSRLFGYNIEAARKRQHLTEGDIAMASHARDLMQTVLRELQAFQRTRLDVKFMIEPQGPTETGDSPWSSP